MENLYEQFFAAMNNIASRNVESAKIDQTIQAEIASIVNIDVGEYKVKYESNIFSAFVLDPTVTYKVGEQVYILVPQGDFSAKKIILGRSKYENQLTYGDKQAATNFFKPHGPNWLEKWYNLGSTIDHTPLGIVATEYREDANGVVINNIPSIVHPTANWEDYGWLRQFPVPDDLNPLGNGKTKFPTNFMAPADIDYQEQEYRRYAKSYEWIIIKADFKTAFIQQHDAGEYGLLVKCIVENPLYLPTDHPQYDATQPQYNQVEFRLQFKDFVGAPYAFVNSVPQSAAFQVAPGVLKGLYSVSLYQDGGFNADMTGITLDSYGTPIPSNPNYSSNNIFVENIDIRFAEKINLTDQLYWTKIDMPYGDSLSVLDHQSIDVVGHLYYGYYTELTDVTTCTFKWFRRAAEIMQGLDNYDNDAGPGWMPIDPGDTNYSINFNRLTVNQSGVPWMWKYKMVVIYGEKTEDGYQKKTAVLSEEFEVYNRDSTYDLSLR